MGVEKINSITRCISQFIPLIYLSICITIKEYLTKNGGHLSPGNTIVVIFSDFLTIFLRLYHLATRIDGSLRTIYSGC